MQRFKPSKLFVIALVTWLSCLGSFSFVTSSQWTVPVVLMLLLLCIRLTSLYRVIALLIIGVSVIYCLLRFDLAYSETETLIESIETPTVFEIASDPMEFATLDGDTHSVDAALQTRLGELLVRLSHPALGDAEISSTWTCSLDLEPSPINKRYRAFARCIDEPIKVRGQNNLQYFADAFRSTLQGLTGGRYESLGAQLLPGLVVGDTSKQSQYLEDTLRESGLGHLTAVSGANVAILLVAVGLLLERMKVPRLYRLGILFLVLGAYLVVVRPEPSVVRASVMAVLALGYWFLGLKKYGEDILMASVLILLFVDPWLALSWGFALSVAATFGLIVLPKVFGITPEDHWLKKSIGVALSAGVATFPVLVAMGASPSFASILANVIAEGFVAPATILGLLAALIASLRSVPFIGGLCENVGVFIADAAIASAQLICWIAEFALRSWFHIPVLSLSGVVLASLAILIWRKQSAPRVRFSSIALVCVVLLGANLTASVSGDWTLASCDVGQGDSTLIRSGQHSAVMVDTGANQDLLQDCLKTFQIDTIETLIITHMHQDHYGAFELLKLYNPEKVIIPTAYVTKQLRAQLEGVFPSIVIASVGYEERHTYGGWSIVQVGAKGDESGTDINNSGVVVHVWAQEVKALLLADVEIEAQAKLLTMSNDWRVDLVKIAHHGSRYQSAALAHQLSAQFGWVSVGQDNSYSHPHPEMISLYKSAGTRLYSTAQCGHLYLLHTTNQIRTSRTCDEL